jgi:hypothetical protein
MGIIHWSNLSLSPPCPVLTLLTTAAKLTRLVESQPSLQPPPPFDPSLTFKPSERQLRSTLVSVYNSSAFPVLRASTPSCDLYRLQHFAMATMPPNKVSRSSTSKKRKPDVGNSNRPAKQSKINSYFSPLHPISSNSKENKSQPVPLNDEQKRVLEMVVEEGKNVFFTGAAGTLFIYIRNPPARFPLFVVGDLACFIDQEPGNRCCSELSSQPSRINTQRNRLLFL